MPGVIGKNRRRIAVTLYVSGHDSAVSELDVQPFDRKVAAINSASVDYLPFHENSLYERRCAAGKRPLVCFQRRHGVVHSLSSTLSLRGERQWQQSIVFLLDYHITFTGALLKPTSLHYPNTAVFVLNQSRLLKLMCSVSRNAEVYP
jgi:hypothetical protein